MKRLPAACLLFLLLLSVLLPPYDASSAGSSPRKVLLLTSYHQGDRWNDSVVKGVREALGTLESVSLSIENLDMRRYPNQDHTRVTAEYIRAKYQGRPQDLILVSDDPALDFLLTVREDLFPNTPVVFCGVNNFTPKRIQGQHNITGINEALSLEATLELALKLFPKTARITAVVSDTEASGRANLQEYRAAAARMKGRVQFDELLNMIDKDAPAILSRLPKDSLVLRLINLLKPEGGYLSIQNSIRILSAHAPVPVFTLWSFDLGDGALGGYVSSGEDQGRVAGNLAIRILEGQEAEQIPVIMNSPNVPMFDYKVMERFGLKESALPKGSVVLNHQLSIWEQYWAWFLGIALFCVLQTFLILNLLTRGTRLHAANTALGESEHFTRSLLETIPVPVFYKGRDGRYQGFNKAFLNFYGRSKEELIGKSVFDITVPDMAKVYHAHDMELFENPGTQIYPYQVKTSEGDLREVIFHKASLSDEHGSVIGLIGAILDVTELKLMERQNLVLVDIIKRSKDFIGVADIKKKAFFVNPAGQVLVGLDGDDAVAKTKIEEYFLTEDLPFVENTILPAVMKEGRWAGEFRFRHFKTGKPVPVLYELFLTEDPETGASTNFATISRDITERKRAEKALIESEALFRGMFKDHIAVMLLVDPNTGQIVLANQAAAQYYGYPVEYLTQMKIQQLNVLSPTKIAEKMAGAFNKQINIFEFQHLLADGQIRDVQVHSTPITVQNQIVLFSIIHDITERKQAEESLRKSEERFLLAMKATHDGLFDWNLETNDIYYSPAWKNMLGYEDHELPNDFSVWEKTTDPEDVKKSWELQRKLISKEIDRFEIEFKMRHKNGHWIDILSRAEAFFNDSGKAVRMVGTHVDITARKQAEADKKRLEAQLRQAQKMESVGRLAGGVAHDFNNMLGVILGHTEMALEETYPESPIHAGLRAIHQAAERSAALTRQLLAFARKQTVAPKVIDINETVAGMLNMLRRLIGEDIDLLWQPGKDLPPVKVDPAQIDQLLANLCVNARDAIAGQGKITIETGVKTFDEVYCADHFGFLPGEYLVLEVNDDGCGMDKKILSHIFEPFFTTKEQGKGTGLGLASVFGMVQQNKGFIDVDSEPGKGTAFKIYLPVYAEKSAGVVEKAPDLSAEQGNETILLVEDESAILQMTTMMLTRLGYTVVAAATPGEAIRLALEYRGRIDLLMTDVVMPEMNGRELAGNLLAHFPDLKRLFMSGYTADIIAHHGVLDEGVHYIQKPFSMKDLGRKLRETLED